MSLSQARSDALRDGLEDLGWVVFQRTAAPFRLFFEKLQLYLASIEPRGFLWKFSQDGGRPWPSLNCTKPWLISFDLVLQFFFTFFDFFSLFFDGPLISLRMATPPSPTHYFFNISLCLLIYSISVIESDEQLATAIAEGADNHGYRALVALLANGIAGLSSTQATIAASEEGVLPTCKWAWKSQAWEILTTLLPLPLTHHQATPMRLPAS